MSIGLLGHLCIDVIRVLLLQVCFVDVLRRLLTSDAADKDSQHQGLHVVPVRLFFLTCPALTDNSAVTLSSLLLLLFPLHLSAQPPSFYLPTASIKRCNAGIRLTRDSDSPTDMTAIAAKREGTPRPTESSGLLVVVFGGSMRLALIFRCVLCLFSLLLLHPQNQ